MKLKTITLFLGLFVFAAGSLVAQDYIGAAKCKMCHNKPTSGEQYNKWAAGPHAKALASLSAEEQKDEKCLKCHAPVAAFASEGVTCEVCHGAGSKYKSMAIMKSREQSVANGLIIPDEKLCLTCHAKGLGNPKEKDFDYATYSAKIAHKK